MLESQIPPLALWKARTRKEADSIYPQLLMLHSHIAKFQERLKDAKNPRGYSVAAEKVVDFKINWPAEGEPNWRETVACAETGLFNRLRGCYHAFHTLLSPTADTRIYMTEQTTRFYAFAKERYPKLIGSEFHVDVPFGTENSAGVRSEDMTALSFPDVSFDVVMSFEVLEHVPDYRAALAQCARVLRPGGVALITAPFISADATLVRASVEPDGSITHHETPDYHGDPINAQGILCYYWFGWSLMDDLRAAGFADAYVAFYASREFGYYGPMQSVIVATR